MNRLGGPLGCKSTIIFTLDGEGDKNRALAYNCAAKLNGAQSSFYWKKIMRGCVNLVCEGK